jgi:hypothetical protein
VCDREPLVPVIVTVKVPAVLELHESVAVPEPDIVPGLNGLQLRPACSEVTESDTVPVKPVPATVMVEATNWPAFTAAGEVALIAKSRKVNITGTVWFNVPSVAMTVTVNVPAALVLHNRVEVFVRVVLLTATLVGLRVHVGPEGDTV